MGESLELELELEALAQLEGYFMEINLVRADGLFCYGCSTATDQFNAPGAWRGRKKISLAFPKMNLLAGKYHFDLRLAQNDGNTVYFGGNIAEFEVDCYVSERGIVYLEHDWREGQ